MNGVRTVTGNAQTVKCRDSKRSGEIAIAAAAEGPMVEFDADAGGEVMRLLVERHGLAMRLPERAHRPLFHGDTDAVVLRFEGLHPLGHFVEDGAVRRDSQDLGATLERHDVDERAAGDGADRKRHAAVEVGHALDPLDQA